MIWINALLFQLLWFAAVLGAANGYRWLALPVLILLCLWNWRLPQTRRADLRMLLVVATIGFLIDSLFAATGWIVYASSGPVEHLAPLWILLMWCGFALTVNHSLAPLLSYRWLALLSGAVFGPLAYFGAARLGAVREFGLETGAMTTLLAVVWAGTLVLLGELARYWRRNGERPA